LGLFGKSIENRDINGYSNEEFFRLLGIPIGSVDKSKLSEITYFTCCKLLSESVAKLGLKLYREKDKGKEKATDHYLYNLLKLRPNIYQSSWNFWSTIEFNKNHYGNSYVYIDTNAKGRNAGKIKGLYILPSESVQIWVDDAGIISRDNAIWYIYKDKTGKEYKINHQQILHFKTSVTSDGGIAGLSVQDILKTSIENAQYGQNFINNYFKQGLFAKGLLQYTGDIEGKDGSAIKTMQKKFESMASGISNAGRILPVPLGFSFSTINTSMTDAQFLELNKYTALNIAAAFGIKPSQINNLERSTHSNIEFEQLSFYIDTLLSTLTMYEQELSYKLLTNSEINNGYFFKFNVDSILRADTKTRFEAYGLAIEKGWLSPNEVREKEDLSPKNNADDLICNGNMQKVQDVGALYKDPVSGKGGEK
jgi:HK97 family phage portal protein